jgi:hypothetical protein
MNYIKYILSAAIILVTVPLLAASLDKTIFSSLEPHKSKTFDLSVPKGKTTISVEQSEDVVKPILNCTFTAEHSEVKESNETKCNLNFSFNDEGQATVEVTNTSNQTIDIIVKQFTVKK